MKPNLLEQAKRYINNSGPRSKRFTKGEEELCVAWMNDELKLTQVQHAMKFSTTSRVYVFLALCARQIFSEKRK